MKTVLALSPQPDLEQALRAGLNNDHYRVLHRRDVDEAEPLLTHGLIDVCIVDSDLSGVQGVWFLEKLRRRAPRCPILIYTSEKKWEWEEEAYLNGVAHILSKPVRPRLLTALLDRLWANVAPQKQAPAPSAPIQSAPQSPRGGDTEMLYAPFLPQSLTVLRDFSGILTHSLNAEAMLKQFLLLLRELFSINRAAIFLRSPMAGISDANLAGAPGNLRVASSLGLSSNVLQHVELSPEAGLGGLVFRLGRILRKNSEEVRHDPNAQKEFEMLSAQVAVPILDRENVLGIAVFDGRVTGEYLLNPELELIYHLLEQLALAIKNIWMHDQISSNHEMLAGILRELTSGCVVVNQDLAILHANKTARKYFQKADRRSGELEFPDLPPALGAKIYQVLKTGSGVSNFKYEPEGSPGTTFNINVIPFQQSRGGLPISVLLLAEDLTQSQQLRKLEVEASNLRLVKTMADRLAHEVGNAMVPLSTHQQLLAEKWKDPEFRSSLNLSMADGVKRVTRLVNQMRFLARDSLVSPEPFPLEPLIEEAFQEARKHQPVKSAQLTCEVIHNPIVLTGDRAALKHAFAEVLLNALQSNLTEPKIGVRMESSPKGNGNGAHSCEIEVLDNGAGFSSEAASKASAPFFTTRNIGLGLGLTVSRRIIENHHGKLEIVEAPSGRAGLVRISLPMDQNS